MAANYVTTEMSPPNYRWAWPTEWRLGVYFSAAPAGLRHVPTPCRCLTVITSLITGVTLQTPTVGQTGHVTSHFLRPRLIPQPRSQHHRSRDSHEPYRQWCFQGKRPPVSKVICPDSQKIGKTRRQISRVLGLRAARLAW